MPDVTLPSGSARRAEIAKSCGAFAMSEMGRFAARLPSINNAR